MSRGVTELKNKLNHQAELKVIFSVMSDSKRTLIFGSNLKMLPSEDALPVF